MMICVNGISVNGLETVKMYRERVGMQASELDDLSNECIKKKVYALESDR